MTNDTEMRTREIRMAAYAAVIMAVSASCNKWSDWEEIQPPYCPDIPVAFDLESTSHLKSLVLNEDGSYTMESKDGDPYNKSMPLESELPRYAKILSFEYRATKDVDMFELWCLLKDAEYNYDTMKMMSLPGFDASGEWKEVRYQVGKIFDYGFGSVGDKFRFDWGSQPDNVIDIRNLKLCASNSDEAEQENEEKDRYAKSITDYLNAEYACSVTSVNVGESEVVISGKTDGKGTYFLAEIAPYNDIFTKGKISGSHRHEISGSTFSITLSRTTELDGVGYDRLLSKWAVYQDGGESDDILSSHAAYASPEGIAAKGNAGSLSRIVPSSKKGLGGLAMNDFFTTDIDALGIKSATINIMPLFFMRPDDDGDCYAHEYCGKTYYFSKSALAGTIDNVLAETSARGISVAGILLISPTDSPACIDKVNGKILQHPNYIMGTYTMPNMTDPESVKTYAAILDFLSERYSDPERRISHWILHNEIDLGSTWTNMGYDIRIQTYMDTYLKSMRMMYNIAHQYDRDAQVFISLTHGWNLPSGSENYSVRDMLEMLSLYGRREGDFYWAPACHSYATDLSSTKILDDDKATYSMDSPNVTFKNLEVLDKWIHLPENLYMGTTLRKAWLSEAGVASGNEYNDTNFRNQAASWAYAWKKLDALEGIEGIQWHNWFDSKDEGTRLGLRKYNDETYRGEAKPVYYTFMYGGTDREDSYFAEQGYLATLGIPDWNIIHEID